MPKCLFCEHSEHKTTSYEDTVFNNKTFQYLQCTHCGLVYVHPLPDTDDLIKMYPVEYQLNLVKLDTVVYNPLFERINSFGTFNTLLDYGCGEGRFVATAAARGYAVTGAEFSPAQVKNLSMMHPNANFISIDDFKHQDTKYDIIFMSNVLEHLTHPKEVMLQLITRLHPDGLFILEGPVENNINLTKYVRKFIFFLRKHLLNKKASHTPTHLLYSNKKNQERFFKDLGLQTLYYKIDESHWPFPSVYKDCNTLMKKMMFCIAYLSVRIGRHLPFWGNNFLYIGRLKD